jgi:hypothetical protein
MTRFGRLLGYFVDLYREHLFQRSLGRAGAHCERQCTRLVDGVPRFEYGRSKKDMATLSGLGGALAGRLHNRETTDSGQYAGSTFLSKLPMVI